MPVTATVVRGALTAYPHVTVTQIDPGRVDVWVTFRFRANEILEILNGLPGVTAFVAPHAESIISVRPQQESRGSR